MKLTAIEIFAGAGGMALGLEKAGFDLKALIEIDKHAAATLQKNRPSWNVLNKDVREINFKKFYQHIDLVSGGFPCQPFSHAGHKLGFDDVRGTVFYEFARAIKEIKPKIFVAENVDAILRNDDGKTLSTIIKILESFQYTIQYRVLNALNYKTPQKRKRVIFVGLLPGMTFEYPRPQRNILTLRDALKKIPKSNGATYSKERARILKLVPPGGSWVDLPISLQKKYLGKSFFSGGGKRGMARRISWDEPCLTLTCSPSQKMTDRIHPDETRPFTVREYARIQTFPDSWKFAGSMYSQYRQIGNAVPVKFAIAIGKALHNSLMQSKLMPTIQI
ncbi:MAG: cytosine-specific methyltransferase [Cenarchaeum symbiont of Oopsacas minuta]|nr:cytosine-specific methyltransferase [Cenarchaeum symbiont of Oopsacas minuta]